MLYRKVSTLEAPQATVTKKSQTEITSRTQITNISVATATTVVAFLKATVASTHKMVEMTLSAKDSLMNGL